MTKPADFYVYTHRRETDGSIFYVGKGRLRRAWQTHSRNDEWNKVRASDGLEISVVCKDMSEVCALTLERIGISHVGLQNLTNQRAGGYGSNCGWSPSEEARKKIGDFHRGKKKKPEAVAKTSAANRGLKRSPELRMKYSIAAKNRVRRPHSPETRAKISASHMGMKPSPETLLKMKTVPRPCGKDSPTYDHTIRCFVHQDGSTFSGTRAEFIIEYGLSDTCVSSVIKGRQKTVKGWRIND